MADNITLCEINDDLKDKLKKFRFRKATDNAAIIMKIEKDKRIILLEEEYNDISIEEVANELPHSQPRYILYSYALHHSDGRISYPLCFIFVTPEGCAPELQMLYAGSLKNLILQVGLTKVFEIRNCEDLTEDWLKEKLSFFK